MTPRFHIASDGQAAVDQERGGGRRKAGGGKAKNSRFGVRGHPNHWEAVGSKAKKTALGSEVIFVNVKVNGDFGSGWRVAGVLKIGKRKKLGDEGKTTIHFQVGGFLPPAPFHLPPGRGLSHKRNL
jgi:hypothetical protein